MIRRPLTVAAALSAALSLSLAAGAESPPEPQKAEGEAPPEEAAIDEEALKKAIDAKLTWETGEVAVGEGLASLKLGEQWRYLDPEQADFVLTQVWGNPPSEQKTLGMIFPRDVGPLDEGSWAVIVDYTADGYVEDDDAGDIDYDELLSDMQEDARANNEARREAGYPTVDVVGWAEPPHYDPVARKLYWAKELAFEGAEVHTLNYDVRVLGRRGFLVLQAVADMGQLPAIREGMQDVLTRTEFNEGHRYEDFDPEIDEVAAYGIGALVAGKLAAKTGLFAALGVALLKAKKLLIVGGIAVVAVLRKIFGKKSE